MRYATCLFAVLLIIAGMGNAFGQEIPFPDSDGDDADVLSYIKLDLMSRLSMYETDEWIAQMLTIAQGLDPFYKDYLYNEHKKNPVSTSIINLFTGGVGSLMEGSTFTGLVSQVGMIASYAVIIGWTATSAPDTRTMFFRIGQYTGLAVGIFSVVMPFFDAKKHNTQLKAAYGLD